MCRDSQKYVVYTPTVVHVVTQTLTLPPCSCVRCPHPHQNQIPAVHNTLFNPLTETLILYIVFFFKTVRSIKSVYVRWMSSYCPGTTSIVNVPLWYVSKSAFLWQGRGCQHFTLPTLWQYYDPSTLRTASLACSSHSLIADSFH